jgi:hypothetical protein
MSNAAINHLLIIPTLPIVGNEVTLFGVNLTVTAVEPASDFAWSIEMVSVAGDKVSVVIPTDNPTF